MFETATFVFEMARRVSVGDVDRAREQLWPLNFNILQTATIADAPIIGIASNIVEIVSLFIDQVPLSRTREILLDMDNPDWRNADAKRPTSFIWKGEENHIRLYPTPDDAYEIWGIVQEIPVVNYPKWFNLLTAIIATENLTKSEQVVGRMQMAQYLAKWRSAFNVA